jgi:hypothetical protein
MKFYPYSAALALTLCVTSMTPTAPVPDGGSEAAARKTAKSCLEAIRKQDWKELAEHLESTNLEAFKATATPGLKRAAADGAGDFRGGVVLGLLGQADPEKLLALPPKEVFVAFTKATLPEGQKWLFAGMEAKVVGMVREGRGLIHILYRARGKVRFAEGVDDRGKDAVKKLRLEGEVTRLGTLTLKQVGGGWKALVPDELRYVVSFLEAEWREK